jgi:transcriptional regulator with XRE-family HTH domain
MNQENRIAKKLGKRLKQLRLQRGWSQEAFAAEAGLDRTYLGGIERGERNPSLKNLARLADTLELPISQLFENK